MRPAPPRSAFCRVPEILSVTLHAYIAEAGVSSLVSVRFQQEPDDVPVPGSDGDVQGGPAVPRGQSDVGAVADQYLDQLQVAGAAAAVQRRLAVGREDVDVDGLVDGGGGVGRRAAGGAPPRCRTRGVRVEDVAKSTDVAAADRVQEQLMMSVVGRRRLHRRRFAGCTNSQQRTQHKRILVDDLVILIVWNL